MNNAVKRYSLLVAFAVSLSAQLPMKAELEAVGPPAWLLASASLLAIAIFRKGGRLNRSDHWPDSDQHRLRRNPAYKVRPDDRLEIPG
jgi:hypothetical protein